MSAIPRIYVVFYAFNDYVTKSRTEHVFVTAIRFSAFARQFSAELDSEYISSPRMTRVCPRRSDMGLGKYPEYLPIEIIGC